jgi:hypothetical protein
MRERAAIRLLPIAGVCALATFVLLVWALPGTAEAASVVSPSGQITGCAKKKGKAKGTLRVVPAGKRCRKGEQRLTWNATGPQGQTGGQGGTGTAGTAGLQSQITSLQTQISELTSQITQLTSQLTALTGQVDSLCGEVGTVVTQTNGILTGLGAPSLTGTLLGLGSLGLSFPSLPSALSPFSCP